MFAVIQLIENPSILHVVRQKWLFKTGHLDRVYFPGATKLKNFVKKDKDADKNWETLEVRIRAEKISKKILLLFKTLIDFMSPFQKALMMLT